MQKKIFILIVLFVNSCVLLGQHQYKILFLNSSKIKIGNKWCQPGDIFIDNQPICWTKERQAMKVQNTETYTQKILVANKEMLKEHKSLSELFTTSKKLATRTGTILTLGQLRSVLGTDIMLLDEVNYSTGIRVDEMHYFFISFLYGQETIYKKLPIKTGRFILDRTIFSIDGQSIVPFSTQINIYYQNGRNRELVIEDCFLDVVPINL